MSIFSRGCRRKKQEAKDMLQAKVIAKLKSSKPKSKTEISQTMEAMTSPETEEV